MNKLTCLTLETFPAGGTVAGVWSQTLAAIFTLLQTDGYSERTDREAWRQFTATWQMIFKQNLPHGVRDLESVPKTWMETTIYKVCLYKECLESTESQIHTYSKYQLDMTTTFHVKEKVSETLCCDISGDLHFIFLVATWDEESFTTVFTCCCKHLKSHWNSICGVGKGQILP